MQSASDSDLLPRRPCAKCSAEVGANDRFCQQCGALANLSCPSCGRDLDPSSLACRTCGYVVPVAARRAQMAQADSPWSTVLRQLQSGLANEFEFERELGRGGQAAVFLARELSLNRLVAIKVLAPGTLTTTYALERFRREATTIAALSHPNIVTIYAVRQVGDLPLFVMRYLGGKSLQRILMDEKRLSSDVVVSILHQVGTALAFAHRRGVVHRDIKPGNVLFDEDGNAIVTDFGIAKDLSSEIQTESGTVIGTPAYMSPEQIYGRGVTAASDQYSLGVMAWEMLTGEIPFTGSIYEIMRGHTDVEIPRLEKLVACSPELDEAIARMVRKKADERWASFSDLLQFLHATAPGAEGPLRDELRRIARRGAEASRAQPVEVPSVQSNPSSLFAILGPDEVEVGDHASFSLSSLKQDMKLPETSAWSVSNEAVVSVEARSGELVAHAVGTALVRAATPVGVLERPIVVHEPKPVSLELYLPKTVLEQGETIRSRARVLDKHGHVIPHVVSWHSSNDAVAALSEDGELRASSPGIAVISADAAQLHSERRVEVAAPRAMRLSVPTPPVLRVGDEVRLHVDAFDRRGNALAEVRPDWTSDTPRIASITPDGDVIARAPGRAHFTVAVDGVVASCDMQVQDRRASAIRIEGAPRQLIVGETFALSARCFDDGGEGFARPVRWSTSTPLLLEIEPSGAVVPLAPGVGRIVATVDSAVAKLELPIVPAPPDAGSLGTAFDRASRVFRRLRGGD
jgi:serine/threonine-protein kinase